jgi:hypothetical protein
MFQSDRSFLQKPQLELYFSFCLTAKKLLPNFEDGHELEENNFEKKVGFSTNTANCVKLVALLRLC